MSLWSMIPVLLLFEGEEALVRLGVGNTKGLMFEF